MQSEIDKKSFLFWDIGRLKLLSENLQIATGILVIGSQRFNKQSEDFRYD